MAAVVVSVAGVDVTDDVVFSTAQFKSLVNGKPGEAKMRVRDLASTYSFTQGADWLLTVDGDAVWRGFVQTISRVYIYNAGDTAESGLQRFWDLEGADLNILFPRRVVFKGSSPTTVEGTQFAAGTADTTAITDLLANWLDLSSDDLDTTTGVVGVGDLDPAQATRAWSGGWYWDDAMNSIAMLPAAIYYIRPETGSPKGTLVYCDVDVPDAPFGLSDVPNGTTTRRFREAEIILDGTSLANDVMGWGMGYGSQAPVFKRDEDATSQTTHGLWQTGRVVPGVYKQVTIDRITDSILNGSPQSKRGAKDDRPAVQLVTYEPGLLVGHKVPFTSNVWGWSDTLPVRQMQVTFETPTDPRYELILSHEIDAPWGFIDQFWPAIPRFPGFSGGWFGDGWTLPAGCDCGITDTFTRTVASGWGTSDAGLPWSATGSLYSVDGSVGMIELTGASNFGAPTLSNLLTDDVTVTVTVTLDDGAPAANRYVGMLGAGIDGGYYQIDLTTGGMLELYTDTGSDSVASAVDLSQPFLFRMMVDGTTFHGKVWQSGDVEPAWTLELPSTVTNFKEVSVMLGREAGSPNALSASFDSLDAVDVNHCDAVQFDDFERTVASGWGVSTDGHVWFGLGPGIPTLSVSGGQGRHINNLALSGQNGVAVESPGPWDGDFTMVAKVKLVDIPIAGLFVYELIGLRDASLTGNSFDKRVIINFRDDTFGGPNLAFGPRTGSTVKVSKTWTEGQTYWIKWQKAGGSHNVKAWDSTVAEPASWDIELTGDSTFTLDRFGVYSQGGSNTDPQIVYYDSIDFDYADRPCYYDCSGDNPDKDTFTRTVVSGLGTSEFVGSPGWVAVSPLSSGSASVNGTQAVLTVGIPYATQYDSYIVNGPTSPGDILEYLTTFSVTGTDVTNAWGGRLFFGIGPWDPITPSAGSELIFSWSTAPTRLSFQIAVHDTSGSALLSSSWMPFGTEDVRGVMLKARVQLDASAFPLTVTRARVWKEIDAEPATWDMERAATSVSGSIPMTTFTKINLVVHALIRRAATMLVDEISVPTSCGPVQALMSQSTPAGPIGYGCVDATRSTTTDYTVPTTFMPNSTFAWRDGLFQRRGTDYTEGSDHQTLTFSDAVDVTSVIRVCYFAEAI